MKCPQCGYVSFDDLESCKNCGRSFAAAEDEEAPAGEVRLQDELFSLKPEESAPPVEDALLPPAELPSPVPEVEEDPGEEGGGSGTGEEEPSPEPVVEPSLLPEEEPAAPVDQGGSEFILDAAGEKEAVDEEEVPGEVVLPPLEVDFDPAAREDEVPAAGEQGSYEAEEIAVESDDGELEPIIDDETVLPEDLWIEEGAGFAPRLAAFAIDAGAILAVLAVFFLSAAAVLGGYGYNWSQLRTPAGIGALFVPFYLLGLFLSMCYYTFFAGWMGTTPGKLLLGLDIQRTDGGSMTYSRAFLRWVGYLVSVTFAGVGFFWIIIDERRRGWHDYLSGTWVKNVREGQVEEG